MDDPTPTTILWLGPPVPWAAGLGTAVHACASVPEMLARSSQANLVVVDEWSDLLPWLRRPGERPPVLAVTNEPVGALRDGADEAVRGDVDVSEGLEAVERARARHAILVSPRFTPGEARFETVVSALPDIVSRIRLDGLVLDFHVPAAFETEFPAAALIGHRLQDMIPPVLASKFESAVATMRATGGTVAYDYTVRVGERTKYREVRVAPLGDDEMISMIRDVTALREQEKALEQSRSDLRALAERLHGVREAERTRLSREVHDVLGQQLTAIRLGAGWFGRNAPDDEAVQARLDDLRAIIDETIGHVRQIATDLRPGILDDFGLQSAIEWQAGQFEERTGLTCVVEAAGDVEPPREVATAAFRIFQESLTNVARHAEASTVEVRLGLTPDTLLLTVSDDGRGLGPEAARRSRSLGVLGMRERARALGGTLHLDSVSGHGTTVECTLPLSPPTP